MFERYTEEARRVIFFGRYEASQYGSPSIETEHVLLGLLREDHSLMKRFLGETDFESEIRREIERHITPGERIPTSVEIPITEECKKVLKFATEEADRLGHRHIGTEHFLLGLLRAEGSLAAQILRGRGLKAAEIREQLAMSAIASDVRSAAETGYSVRGALSRLDEFLTGFKWHKADDLLPFFSANARFVDAHGRQWNRAEIEKEFVTLFAPYAKKNATHLIEQTVVD